MSGHQSGSGVAACRQTGLYAAHTANGRHLHEGGRESTLTVYLNLTLAAMPIMPCIALPRHTPFAARQKRAQLLDSPGR